MLIDKLESNVRSYVRHFPVVFQKARGSYLYDKQGQQYLDFFDGAGALNYGHNNPRLVKPVIEYLQGDNITHSLDLATEAQENFLATFDKYILQPRGLDYKVQFTGPTGTNANEAALKLARLYTSRHNVIAFSHAFHGVSLGSLAATSGQYFRQAAGTLLGNVTFLPYEGYIEGSLNYLRQVLDDPSSGVDKPAAIILETVQCEGGINLASMPWLKQIEAICRANQILLIVDDIQAGCGRTSTFFSFEKAGIKPDLISLSKSISGLGLPMSLLLIKPELDVWQPAQHNGTFRGNNLAFVSGKAAIEAYWQTDDFEREVYYKGVTVRKHLEKINSPLVETVRGRGLINGLVMKNPADASKIQELCFKENLILELCGAHDEVVKLMPALTIEEHDLLAGLDIITKIVEQC